MPKVIGFDQKVYDEKTCQECGAINQYTPGEVRNLYRGKDYSGTSEGVDGINCANCGNGIVVRSW